MFRNSIGRPGGSFCGASRRGRSVPNSSKQAEGASDGLLKALYARLFDKIVALVNSALGDDSSKPNMGKDERLFVGLLDIFGFESYVHSLEQLLINYTRMSDCRRTSTILSSRRRRSYTRRRTCRYPLGLCRYLGVVASLEDGVLRCWMRNVRCDRVRSQFVAKLDRVSDGDVNTLWGTARTERRRTCRESLYHLSFCW